MIVVFNFLCYFSAMSCNNSDLSQYVDWPDGMKTEEMGKENIRCIRFSVAVETQKLSYSHVSRRTTIFPLDDSSDILFLLHRAKIISI
jgi:hypothetical protein